MKIIKKILKILQQDLINFYYNIMIDNFGFPPIILCEDEKIKPTTNERLYFDSNINIRRIFTEKKQFTMKQNVELDDIEEINEL